jgi:glycosyltransferase involved in cell wall biosynthesis
MACGKPIIVSASGGMRETISHERTGLVVPKGDPAALADAAYRLLKDTELRERLRLNASKYVSNFDNVRYVDRLDGLYRAVT